MELSPRVRGLLSLVIGLHVTAVFVAPFTFSSSPAPGMAPPSPFAGPLMDLFQPYIDAMFLRHGYAFFAPDPGPSHLFRVRLDYDDGRPSDLSIYPDRRRQRPRLLYHRHFMLSERLALGYVPAVAPREIADDPLRLVEWRRSRENYETYFQTLRDSYADHLRHRYGADRVVVERVEHRLLTPDEVLIEGRSIADETLMETHPDDRPAGVAP